MRGKYLSLCIMSFKDATEPATQSSSGMSINSRVRYVLESKDITHEQVAELLNLNRASVSHQLRGDDTDSIKLLVAVRMLTNARYDWLISGEGEALEKGTPKSFKEAVAMGLESPPDYRDELPGRLESLENTVESLEDTLISLAKAIKKLQK